MERKRLSGVRVGILVADGFEQVEVTAPRRALQKAGADVRIISLRPGRIRGMNLMWPGRKLPVDDTVVKARPEDYGALYIPGGFVNPDLLRQSEHARSFVQQFVSLGRPVACMCHGPELLVSAGLVRDRHLTSWPGIADDLRNAGAQWEDAPLVRDNLLISSRGPQDLRSFVPAMLDLFAEHAPVAATKLRRRVHWAAQLSRLATAASLGAAIYGMGQLPRALRRARLRFLIPAVAPRPRRAIVAAAIARNVGLATAFGGALFGKLALDDAVRVLPAATDRGRLLVKAWRRFMVPSGIGLAAAIVGWFASRHRRRGALRSAGDVLLAAAATSAVVNAFSVEKLARTSHGAAVPVETGRSAAPGAGPGIERMLKTGVASGIAHAAALAGLIGVAAGSE